MKRGVAIGLLAFGSVIGVMSAISLLGDEDSAPIPPPSATPGPAPLALPPAPAAAPPRLVVEPSDVVVLRGSSDRSLTPAAVKVVIANIGGLDALSVKAGATGDAGGLVAVEGACAESLAAGDRCELTLSVAPGSVMAGGPILGQLLITAAELDPVKVPIRIEGAQNRENPQGVGAEPVEAPRVQVWEAVPLEPVLTAPVEDVVAMERALRLGDVTNARRRQWTGEGQVPMPLALEVGPDGVQRSVSRDVASIGSHGRVQQPDPDVAPGLSTWPVEGSRLLTMGTEIRATLAVGIVNELVGQVRAMVDTPVYAASFGPSGGRVEVVPAGSVLIGTYGNQTQDTTRLDVKWKRLQTPDLVLFDIEDGFSSADEQGRQGIPAEVDNRYVERFAAPVITAVLDAGVELGRAALSGDRGGSNADLSLGASAVQPLSAFGDASQQLLKEALSVRRRLWARPGDRIRVQVTRDLRLRRTDEVPVVVQAREEVRASAANAVGGDADQDRPAPASGGGEETTRQNERAPARAGNAPPAPVAPARSRGVGAAESIPGSR